VWYREPDSTAINKRGQCGVAKEKKGGEKRKKSTNERGGETKSFGLSFVGIADDFEKSTSGIKKRESVGMMEVKKRPPKSELHLSQKTVRKAKNKKRRKRLANCEKEERAHPRVSK